MDENGSDEAAVSEDCSELKKEIEDLKSRLQQYEQSIANHRRLLLNQLEQLNRLES
tara:strand:- start:646 stop:813 length:168 start_codon:yes stop_codon:yes gene_type:complete